MSQSQQLLCPCNVTVPAIAVPLQCHSPSNCCAPGNVTVPAIAEHLQCHSPSNCTPPPPQRGSERDLPECSSGGAGAEEACNLSHQRYWQPPIVERLCRCPGHTPCPVEANGPQHISNRAHLQVRASSTLKDSSSEGFLIILGLIPRQFPQFISKNISNLNSQD